MHLSIFAAHIIPTVSDFDH